MGIKQMKISDTWTLYFWHFAILSGKKRHFKWKCLQKFTTQNFLCATIQETIKWVIILSLPFPIALDFCHF